MAETYTITSSDGHRFTITLPAPLRPPASSRGSVFVAGKDVPIGSVEHAYEARTIGGRSLGFYPSRADAAAALCKAAAWDTDVPGNLLVREVERSSPPPTPTPQPYKGRGSNLFNIGLNA